MGKKKTKNRWQPTPAGYFYDAPKKRGCGLSDLQPLPRGRPWVEVWYYDPRFDKFFYRARCKHFDTLIKLLRPSHQARTHGSRKIYKRKLIFTSEPRRDYYIETTVFEDHHELKTKLMEIIDFDNAFYHEVEKDGRQKD